MPRGAATSRSRASRSRSPRPSSRSPRSRSASSPRATSSTASAASGCTAASSTSSSCARWSAGAETMGAGLAVDQGDPRITRVGALLRRTSIDELPNLVNVLRGDMAIVGPAPHRAGPGRAVHRAPARAARGAARASRAGRRSTGARPCRGTSASSSTSGTSSTGRWRLDLRILARTARLVRARRRALQGGDGRMAQDGDATGRSWPRRTATRCAASCASSTDGRPARGRRHRPRHVVERELQGRARRLPEGQRRAHLPARPRDRPRRRDRRGRGRRRRARDAGARARLRHRRRPPRRLRGARAAAGRAGSSRCPEGLTARDAMALGTAGFTAALSIAAPRGRRA